MITFLASLVVLAFATTAVSFVLLVWRLSRSLTWHVATERQRSKHAERFVAMLQEYIETQRATNEQVWMALQVQADRLNRFAEKKLTSEQ